MNGILVDYYLNVFEVVVILLLFSGVGAVACWWLWRRMETLRKELDGVRTKYDPAYLKALHNHLQSAVAHEFVKGLDYISKKSTETLDGLGKELNVLREKQDKIIVKTHDLTQHARNILDVFAPEPNKLQKELLSIRQLVESVLSELFPFSQSKGVVLWHNLEDVEPTALDRDATLVALNNVIHNAIKYSFPGGVVEVDLSLERGMLAGTEKTICVEVKDTGQGIRDEDQNTIFDLKVRGDGLIEPGSGLGLYLAREAARRQDGDVILVRSSLNQGSVFRIILPYQAIS